MPLENAQYISELNPLWPLGSDGVNTSDDHHRNTKTATQQSLPKLSGPMTCSQGDLNLLEDAATTGSKQGLNVPGTVLMGMWPTPPNGYLLCDGSAIPGEHTDLIAIIGANTPDLRGEFVRGWSTTGSQGDPDGPRAAGDLQTDAFDSHTHSITTNTAESGSPPSIITGGQAGGNAGSSSTLAAGGAETRPRNMAMVFVIKW